ncbi:septal ring lytic transglycosylase RlpA family protein [Leeia oryzae]|uniref:septal ring lytic transglycosylase RlpA family protein n=1 Tax=Leeia oryzae TaxID=356662 RepID=UPI00037B1FD1|nr:septal ring lytic transglycosylase RlpA family protein [Leeia oryzae]
MTINRLTLAGACAVTLLLAACGTSQMPQNGQRTPDTGPPKPAAKTSKTDNTYVPGAKPSRDPKLPPPSKEGGYYLDDGPAEVIPPGLENTPDAEPKAEPLNRFANKPYNVLGDTWVPDTTGKPYVAEGRASWYGKKFHGKRTSSGDLYDMFGMSAAHRTLPIPSYARITNLENGKSVIVRINDRGPFHSERLIDLSFAAAFKLGYSSKGSTRVRVERVFPIGQSPSATQLAAQDKDNSLFPAASPSTDTPAGSDTPTMISGALYLQLGSFSLKANAEALKEKLAGPLAALGKDIQVIFYKNLHKVVLGTFDNEQLARASITEVKRLSGLQAMLLRP